MKGSLYVSSLPSSPSHPHIAHDCTTVSPPFVGQEPSDSVVDGMMSEAPGPLNFTMFLTLFGEKLTGEWEWCQALVGWRNGLGCFDGYRSAPVVNHYA